MQIAFYILLFLFGACFGSFLCCQARRLHLSASAQKVKNKRSVCLSCHYQLKWYDNLPIISWLFLKGKCRKCGQKIGLGEFLSELGLATAFLLLGIGLNSSGLGLEALISAPLQIALFVSVLVLVSGLTFLAIYDGLYGQLPVPILTFCAICAIIMATLREWASFSSFDALGPHLANICLAIAVLGGTYLALYLISKGKWVGDGDWILCTILAIALGTPWLALITLFLSNFIACLVMAPIVHHYQTKKIYFGPFLVIAFVIVFAFSNFFSSLLG